MSNKKEANNISDQLSSWLTEATENELSDEKDIYQIDETHLQVEQQVYQVVENYREGFEFEAFKEKYQPYFDKFEFIVGDWGHEKLRLRGFYQLNKRNVPQNQTIDLLDDYIKEYCNFGCRHFVVAKDGAVEEFNELHRRRFEKEPRIPKPKSKNRSQSRNKSKHINTKDKPTYQKGQPNRKSNQKITDNKAKDDFKIKNADSKKTTPTKERDTQTTNKQTRKKSFVIKRTTKK